jgi:pimeloyl-ACP methyl ester carboxylesterase
MPNTAQIVGSGPNKVICLNGWFGHARGWGPLMHSLDTQHFNYAFMDYRGYGARKGSGGPYTIAQIGHDVLALADHLGWQRFSLVGHSMGGLGIQQVLADAPARVQALVGVTPVPADGFAFDDAGWAFFSSAARDAAARKGHPGPHHRQPPDRRVAGCDGQVLAHAFRRRRLRCLSHGLGQDQPLSSASRARRCRCWWWPASTIRALSVRRPARRPGCSTTPTRGSKSWPTPAITRWTRPPLRWPR